MELKDCILNPNYPYLYYHISDGKISFALLYTQKYKDPKGERSFLSDNYLGTLKRDEIDTLCTTIKEELKLDYLDWGYYAGRCILDINVKDVSLIYKIVQAFLNRGFRIYMNDETHRKVNFAL